MICLECAEPIGSDSRYCTHCGQPATHQKADTAASGNAVYAGDAMNATDAESIPSVRTGQQMPHPMLPLPLSRSGKVVNTSMSVPVPGLQPVMSPEALEAERAARQAVVADLKPQAASPSTSLVLMAVQSAAATPDLSDGDIHALLAQANLSRLRRQWNEAVDACVAVLRARPGSQSAHSLLGDIYRDQNKPEEAVQWYRMAVDLKHNPADEAKLRATELELTENNLLHGSQRRIAGDLPMPLSASGTLTGGTTALMGVSPRSWLRGLTIASLAFVGIMGVALLTSHPNRKPTLPPNGVSMPASSGFGMGLPSTAPMNSAFSRVPTRPLSPSIAFTGGMGMPGDRIVSSGSGATPLPGLPQTGSPFASAYGPQNSRVGAMGSTLGSTTPALSPASVLRVTPLNAAPMGMNESPRTGITDANPSGSRNDLPAALPDGTRILHISTSGNVASITASVPVGSNAGSDFSQRGKLIRNAYRAARVTFVKYPDVTQATVTLQAESGGANGVTLVIAQVNRNIVESSSPDLDSPELLEQRLVSVRWPDGAASAEAAPQNAASNGFEQTADDTHQ